MEVIIEEKGLYDRDLTIRIPAQKVGDLMEQEFRNLAGTVRLPGFRPGKVPRSLLEKRYSQHVAAEVAERLVRESYTDVVRDKDLNLVGPPVFEKIGEVARNQDFTYTARIQIFPVVEATGYRQLALTRLIPELDDAQIDETLVQLQMHDATFDAVAGAAARDGDKIVLDFAGTVNGESFVGGSATDYSLQLGQGHFLPEFESQLIGAVAGEEREVSLQFPENYGNAELSGKPAIFRCQIKEVQQRQLPPLNDDFARNHGITEGGVVALREQVAERLRKEGEEERQRRLRQDLFGQLLKANPLELPGQLVEQEVVELVKRAKESYKKEGIDPERLELSEAQWQEQYRQTAVDRVLLGLLIGSIARQEQIEVTEAGVEEHLDNMVVRYGNLAEQVKGYLRTNDERMNEIRGTVLEQAVIQWVIDHGVVEEKQIPYKELFAPSAESTVAEPVQETVEGA